MTKIRRCELPLRGPFIETSYPYAYYGYSHDIFFCNIFFFKHLSVRLLLRNKSHLQSSSCSLLTSPLSSLAQSESLVGSQQEDVSNLLHSWQEVSLLKTFLGNPCFSFSPLPWQSVMNWSLIWLSDCQTQSSLSGQSPMWARDLPECVSTPPPHTQTHTIPKQWLISSGNDTAVAR